MFLNIWRAVARSQTNIWLVWLLVYSANLANYLREMHVNTSVNPASSKIVCWVRTTTWQKLGKTQDTMAHIEEGTYTTDEIMRTGAWPCRSVDMITQHYLNHNNNRAMMDLHNGDKVMVTKEGNLKGCTGWFLNVRVTVDGTAKAMVDSAC
jgi:hypothetical protein